MIPFVNSRYPYRPHKVEAEASRVPEFEADRTAALVSIPNSLLRSNGLSEAGKAREIGEAVLAAAREAY